jgi:16S rRNA (cytosine1402-N4)-methyltransferase
MAYQTEHQTVLLHETIDALDIKAGDVVIDGTTGGGGHSEEIIKRAQGNVTLVCLDLDQDALDRSKQRLESSASSMTKMFFVRGNFIDLEKLSKSVGINSADKIVLDLGLSSFQLQESGRGFTFQKNEPLSMTFSKEGTDSFTASDMINSFEEENIADIIYGYGEEKFSRRIAKSIVEAREIKKIETTTELAEVIKRAVPVWYRHGRIHPATKTFQAIRIAVNNELEVLKNALKSAYDFLNPNGRIAVISFHSLEDRIVKNFFRQLAEEEKGLLYTKKPITPNTFEIKNNPRSRSAKLRGLIKIINKE